MAYYVDTGDGQLWEADNIRHAREIAQHALDQARAFRDRMGWTPFWGRCVEIRKGPKNLGTQRGGEPRNQLIVSRTKTHDILYLKD